MPTPRRFYYYAVIFLPLSCILFFSRYSLSSADKAEEGKECSNLKSMHSKLL